MYNVQISISLNSDFIVFTLAVKDKISKNNIMGKTSNEIISVCF